MQRSRIARTLLAANLAITSAALGQQAATLAIDLAQVKAKVSPQLYGLMTEEINYSYDGGLYAELVRNRTFRSDWTGVLNWFVVEKGSSSAKIGVDSATGPSAALTNSGKLEVTKADANNPAGVLNEGYWGIAVRPNTEYTASFFSKSDKDTPLPVQIALVSSRICTSTNTRRVGQWPRPPKATRPPITQ